MWVKLNNRALDLPRNVGVPSGGLSGDHRGSSLDWVFLRSQICTLRSSFLWRLTQIPLFNLFLSVPLFFPNCGKSKMNKNKTYRKSSVPHTDILPPTVRKNGWHQVLKAIQKKGRVSGLKTPFGILDPLLTFDCGQIMTSLWSLSSLSSKTDYFENYMPWCVKMLDAQ